MPLKASAGHYNRFVVETEVGIPGDSDVKNDPVMKGNISAQYSITEQEEHEYRQFGVGRWKDLF